LWAEQDLLNEIFQGNVVYLPLKWNMILDQKHRKWLRSAGYIIFPYSGEEISEAEERPYIIHYVTQEKPWLLGCNHRHKNLYWKYAERTPFYKSLVNEYRYGSYGPLPYLRRKMKLFSRFIRHGLLKVRYSKKQKYIRVLGITLMDTSKRIS
jgi:lipopolysaccharide biosynthesis glycosyltransferase